MRKATILTVACSAALLIPAASGTATPGNGNGGKGGKSAVAKECAKLKKADKAAFRATWGKHAMRNCIKGKPEVDTTPSEFKNAAKECRAERAEDPDAFMEFWGTNSPNPNSKGAKRNAFGKCVSATAQGEDPEETTPAP